MILLLAFGSGGLKLVAFLPAYQFRHAGRLPAERESETRHRGVAYEIHVGTILITGLVIMLVDVLALFVEAPGFGMALELHAFD